MKTKQEQIEETVKDIKSVLIKTHKRCRTLQEDYMQDKYAEGIYKAGYRKASDVIDEFVERVKERLEEFTKQDYEDGVPYYHADCEQIDNVIDDVADEMRQEVEK